jgi:AcrR family transcriptional regulator
MSKKDTEDPRTRHTRERLQGAVLELLETYTYDAMTVQQIADYAEVSRATFYLHYESKDALYLAAHMADIRRVLGDPLSREELLDRTPPARMVEFYKVHWQRRDTLRVVFFSKDARPILRHIEVHSAERLHRALELAFSGRDSEVPLNLLAEYLAGAQMRMMTGWLERRFEMSPPALTALLHRLQRAALCDALRIT